MARKRKKMTPKKVKIGYLDFKINPKTRKWGTRHKALGMIVPESKNISYDKTQNVCELPNTILHEILHGIAYVFDINFPNDNIEEKIIWKMANGLCTVFKDNPSLLEWIQYRLEQDSDKTTTIPKPSPKK